MNTFTREPMIGEFFKRLKKSGFMAAFLFCSASSWAIINTFPYVEDFESEMLCSTNCSDPCNLGGGWKNASQYGLPAGGTHWRTREGSTPSSSTGPDTDHTLGNTTGNYLYVETSGCNNTIADLVSDQLDFTAVAVPALEFWYHMLGATMGSIQVGVSTDGGLNFTTIEVPFTDNQDAWQKKLISLEAYAGMSNVRIRIRAITGTSFTSDMAIDDIKVSDCSLPDIDLTGISLANGNCFLGAQEQIMVGIKNVGCVTIAAGTSIQVGYSINGGIPVSEVAVLPALMAPNTTYDFTFMTEADLSGGIDYAVTVTVELAGSASGQLTLSETIRTGVNTYPYVQDFESGFAGWSVQDINGLTSWALGTPAKSVINSAYSGSNAWVTGLTDSYSDNENGAVLSPCFDMRNLLNAEVSLRVWWNCEFSWDGAVLQSSVDGGSSWQNVGAFGDPDNWYTDNTIVGAPGGSMEGWSGRNSSSNGSGGWVLAKHDISYLTGQSLVYFRIAFGTDGSVIDDGFAFDDFSITGAPLNDPCDNAIPISCGTTISGSNVDATDEPGVFAACGVVQTTAGVWYTFTGDGSEVTLSTCSAANFDTKISVYTGGCAAPTCVAGNDDACPSSRSSVTFVASNGTVYLVLIHGFGGAAGTFDLTMTCISCPTFSGAPANVTVVNSTCGSGCTLAGGSITAPTGTPCPAGSTLQYNVNNSGWTTSLPSYNQAGPAQTISTRCACDNDANNVSAESNPVSTIPGTLASPVVPANGFSTVACLALATQPTPPTVTGCDGSIITPTGPTVTNNPNPLTCEGSRTYTWIYSCGSTSSTWSFLYIIERQPFTVPANGAATVNSPALATQPTPPAVMSNCGETLTPSGPVVTNVPNTIVCTGTRTYAWTYTDCEGNTAVWSFVYTIIDNTPPMVSCSNQTVTFNGQEIITLNAGALATVTDNCGTPTITLNPTTVTCQQVGQQVPVTVTASDGINTATCTSMVTVAGLPCGWSQNPDGVNCTAGNSISFNAATGVYTATSTGCFYGPPYTADETSFAQRTLCGNGSITALVTGISGSALGWAGVVMRENNAAGAKKAQLMTNLSTHSRREFRTTTNGASQPQQFPSQDRYWLRITRVGNQFTMFVSPNGVNWYPAGAQNIVMGNCIQMGLAATNYTANSTVTATFANVSFTGSSGTLALPGGGEAALAPHSSPLTPDFEVYPNPTGGELNVDLAQYVGRAVRLEVYSLEGKLLQFSELDEVQNTLERLDLKGLQNGMYLVKVKSAGLPDATKRIILQRG